MKTWTQADFDLILEKCPDTSRGVLGLSLKDSAKYRSHFKRGDLHKLLGHKRHLFGHEREELVLATMDKPKTKWTEIQKQFGYKYHAKTIYEWIRKHKEKQESGNLFDCPMRERMITGVWR